jgi:hypothetical protein
MQFVHAELVSIQQSTRRLPLCSAPGVAYSSAVLLPTTTTTTTTTASSSSSDGAVDRARHGHTRHIKHSAAVLLVVGEIEVTGHVQLLSECLRLVVDAGVEVVAGAALSVVPAVRSLGGSCEGEIGNSALQFGASDMSCSCCGSCGRAGFALLLLLRLVRGIGRAQRLQLVGVRLVLRRAQQLVEVPGRFGVLVQQDGARQVHACVLVGQAGQHLLAQALHLLGGRDGQQAQQHASVGQYISMATIRAVSHAKNSLLESEES